MKPPTSYWTTFKRRLDGTDLGIGHEHSFHTEFEKLAENALARFSMNTGVVTMAAAAANATVLSFTVPKGKTLKVWDHGGLRTHADLSARLRNTTGAGTTVISDLIPSLQSSATDINTPIAKVDATAADQTVEVQASNANAAGLPISLYLACTLE